jgi:hypothetical protein
VDTAVGVAVGAGVWLAAATVLGRGVALEPEEIAPLATTPPARMATRAMPPTTKGAARLERFATGAASSAAGVTGAAWSAAVSWRLQRGQTPSPANGNGPPQNGQNPAGGT